MPLAWLALGVVLGLFAGSVWAAPAPAILLPLGGLGGAWALARSGGLRVGLPLLVAAGVLLGVLRAGPGLLAPEGLLPRFHGQEVELRGTLTGVAELVGAQVRFRLEAEAVRGDGTWRPSTGAVQVWAGANIDPVDGRGHPFLAHGDVVTLRGVLDAPRSIGSFDYREHLAARGIGSELARASVVGVEIAKSRESDDVGSTEPRDRGALSIVPVAVEVEVETPVCLPFLRNPIKFTKEGFVRLWRIILGQTGKLKAFTNPTAQRRVDRNAAKRDTKRVRFFQLAAQGSSSVLSPSRVRV